MDFLQRRASSCPNEWRLFGRPFCYRFLPIPSLSRTCIGCPSHTQQRECFQFAKQVRCTEWCFLQSHFHTTASIGLGGQHQSWGTTSPCWVKIVFVTSLPFPSKPHRRFSDAKFRCMVEGFGRQTRWERCNSIDTLWTFLPFHLQHQTRGCRFYQFQQVWR